MDGNAPMVGKTENILFGKTWKNLLNDLVVWQVFSIFALYLTCANMKKRIFTILVAMLFVPASLLSQSYNSLWKQVEDAQDKDLPKTAIASLQKIENKAVKEKAYGQLLKSTLLYAKLQAEVAPDSLEPAVSRLVQQQQNADQEPLKAVYAAVLATVYGNNHQLEGWEQYRQKYYQQALAHPQQLAAVAAADYAPFVIPGKDSECYDHDLLSVIGSELEAWDVLSRYYSQSGNRRAACLTTLWLLQSKAGRGKEKLAQSTYIRQLDSLISSYGDLSECGEVAIARADYMEHHTDASPSQQYDWLQQALQRWGTWKNANVLRNKLAALTNPSFQMTVPHQVAEANKAQTIQLNHLRHLESLTLRVYRTTLKGDTDLNPTEDKDYRKIKSGMTEMTDYSRTLNFSGHAEYDVFKDSVVLAALPPGVYLLECATMPATQVTRTLYFVSGVRLISQALPDDKIRYVVVDATTGQPLSRASVRLSMNQGWNQPKETKTLICNHIGETEYAYKKNLRPSGVFAFTDKDAYCPEQNSYGRYTYYEHQYTIEHAHLFTDRSIYRPGQTVHVTGIFWKEKSETENIALAGKQVTVALRDANFKLVEEQQVVTDEYGKCHTTFTLPIGLLNGRFTLRAANGSTSFRVEEYQRPTFQVEFDDYQQPYQQGDVVKAQAKATTYAGVPVQGAQVKYTVKRRMAFWWMSYAWYGLYGRKNRNQDEEVLHEGVTTTADDGTFIVEMPMTLPEESLSRPMFYHFVVEADVTDMAGETHSGTMTLPLGSKSSVLTCDLPQKVRADQLPMVTFQRRNAAGQPVAGTVRYRLDGGKWREIAANTAAEVLKNQKKSGKHRLEAICENDSLDMTFVLFSLDDKTPATLTDDWFYVSDKQFVDDDTPITVQVGSSDPDLHIVYGIFSGNEVVESGVIEKDGELENRKIEYDADYGNGLLMTYAWVKNGVCHTHQTYLRRPMPDKQLKMTWTTFRDRLTPGQQEEWRLKVKRPDGTPAHASVMTVLYDKSLDAIYEHDWTFTPTTYLSQPSTGWMWHNWGSLFMNGALNYKILPEASFTYSRFDRDVYPEYRNMYFVRGTMRRDIQLASAAPETAMLANKVGAVKMDAADQVMQDEVATKGAAEHQKEGGQQQMRENLKETAFCYPTLEADSEGDVVLKFTLPESLTTWRLMSIANTPDMCYGKLTGEAVAQKEVMIQPNMPRFLRMGDAAQLAARIFNTSEKAHSGKARLQLIDPECQQTVHEQTVDFSVEAGKTTSVMFTFQPMETWPILICKVMAEGDGFADGEQHYLPILPDREYVTRTVPYTQHQTGVKSIDLTKLFPSGTSQQRLTVEYTNNPAWLMVQALPVVGQPWEHSAIEQAAAYYSNLLAKTLLKNTPNAKTTFEQWQRESGSEQTLMSELQKNQELKDLVLAETPWVADGAREMEQRQRLADFFDENAINNRLNTAIEKLQKLQQPDGSFSWYPGMQGSTAITVAIEEMLTRLQVMTGQQSAIQALHDKAFNYLGESMVELVETIKKDAKKGVRPTFPSLTALRWLYVCALDQRTLSARVKSANNYLIALLKKDIKRQSIYEKALTAVVLAKQGQEKLAAQYIQSLKEYTVYTEEMGRYYDTQKASYSWYDYKIPTEVAAIEAIQMVTPQDQQTVDEMRRWLLQEKRTQSWDTPINSVNAIYAFLKDQQSLVTTGQPTVLAIDGQPIEQSSLTAGLGYVKASVSEPKGQTFTATKTSEGTSWGAVYAQFLQKTSEVAASQSGMTVKRELLTNGALKVGDRVKVRITITATRDMDFVQVTDRRAACMEPLQQLSGYRQGAYCSPKDFATNYYFDRLSKGRHVIETEYYIDRVGSYETGLCTVGCAYAPAFRATAPSMTIMVK